MVHSDMMVIYSDHRGSRGATPQRIAIAVGGEGHQTRISNHFLPSLDGLHFPGQLGDKGLLSITESETADNHWWWEGGIIGRLTAAMQIARVDTVVKRGSGTR
ncbi:hypothetical protein AVEN_96101-1 [Araneus ventricosus]|uniref:Uncharacterized protein n=1 Tax=Araneus ventricosus TaxID=182803 RepID=A0A4Y2B3G8_ARAVE|nr:hypothetical protein AVEN_96101-1 [Araneus ventricosus]